MKRISVAILVVLLVAISTVALAHPGRTDKYGGHTDRRTGQYHKH